MNRELINQVGSLQQVKGPFESQDEIRVTGARACKIGISIGEDDFMSWKSNIETGKQGEDFIFTINGEEIHMGRTYMYETDHPVSNAIITFPDGAPQSVIVDIAYYPQLD